MNQRSQDRLLILLIMITVFLVTMNIFSLTSNNKENEVVDNKNTSTISNKQSVIEEEEEIIVEEDPIIEEEKEEQEEGVIQVTLTNPSQEEYVYEETTEVEIIPEDDNSEEEVIISTEGNTSNKRNSPSINIISEIVSSINDIDITVDDNDVEEEYVYEAPKTNKEIESTETIEPKKEIVQAITNDNKVYFLNVNKNYDGKSNGDCIILESTINNKKIYAMIDTGRSSQKDIVLKFLRENNINELEWILITHFHGDHYGALNDIVNEVNVKKIYMKEYSGYTGNSTDRNKFNNNWNNLSVKYTLLRDIPRTNNESQDERSLSLGDYKFKIYNVNNVFERLYDELGLKINTSNDFCINYTSGDSEKCSENVNSAVVLAKVNGKSLLLTGDIGNYPDKLKELCDNICSKENKCSNTCGTNKEEYTTYIAKKALKETSKIDIYKASHHGVSSNNPRETLEKLNIQYAVITGGPKNRETNKETVQTTIKKFNYLGINNNNVFLTEDGHVYVSISSNSQISIVQDTKGS